MGDTILVTGGAGFIGSNFIRRWLLTENAGVVNLDQLTYAGNTANLESVRNHERYCFARGNICDQELVRSLFANHSPRALLHFAAESHVDRSILGLPHSYGPILRARSSCWKNRRGILNPCKTMRNGSSGFSRFLPTRFTDPSALTIHHFVNKRPMLPQLPKPQVII